MLLIKDDELLEKYNIIRNKVNNSMKKGFENESISNEKCQKIEIESYEGIINTNLHGYNVLNECSTCICL